MEQPGLLNGYMGIILFLYRYSRYTHLDNYKELADELVDLTYSKLNKSISSDFANGLAGIGWGFKYLKNNHFIEMDDDVLEEIDTVVFGKSIDDLLKEIENEVPLYSEGLYFIEQDLNKEKVGRIYAHLHELFFHIENRILPVQYINSVLYTLIGIRNAGYLVDELSNLFNLYLNMVCGSSELKRCDEVDIIIFNSLVKQFDNLDFNEKKISLVDDGGEYSLNRNLDNFFGWQRFLFSVGRKNDFTGLVIQELEKNVADRISNLNSKDLSLSGLAGVGLDLMI